MNLTKATVSLAISVALIASPALADDFKTINGKEYKNATVSRVEPDGIMLKTKSGISKVYVVELPKEVHERFYRDPAKANAQQNAAVRAASEAAVTPVTTKPVVPSEIQTLPRNTSTTSAEQLPRNRGNMP